MPTLEYRNKTWSWLDFLDQIKKDALAIAHKWNKAWNGQINLDTMMSLHHEDLQYYWHGTPMTYDGFEEVLEKYVIGIETYDNKVINPIVTVVDKNNAVVGFQLASKDSPASEENPEDAFTLVITRVNSEWKIIHIHEG